MLESTRIGNNKELRYDEQEDEAYYDERSDADDDVEKGKIKFSKKKLYGRDKELQQLSHMYYDCMMKLDRKTTTIIDEQQQMKPNSRTSTSTTSSNNTKNYMARASRATSMGFVIDDFDGISYDTSDDESYFNENDEAHASDDESQ